MSSALPRLQRRLYDGHFCNERIDDRSWCHITEIKTAEEQVLDQDIASFNKQTVSNKSSNLEEYMAPNIDDNVF